MNPTMVSSIQAFQYTWRGWILAALFTVLAWARLESANEVSPFWLALIALGAGWRWYSGHYIGSHSNSLHMDVKGLADSGPYLFSRHPLYLANMVTGAGLIFFANCLPAWGSVLLLLLVIGHHMLLAHSEELYLLATLGEPYRNYRTGTSRWFNLRALIKWMRFLSRTTSEKPVGTPLPGIWLRQGSNLGKTAMAVFTLWIMARYHL